MKKEYEGHDKYQKEKDAPRFNCNQRVYYKMVSRSKNSEWGHKIEKHIRSQRAKYNQFPRISQNLEIMIEKYR